jgi:hypothetical protein
MDVRLKLVTVRNGIEKLVERAREIVFESDFG